MKDIDEWSKEFNIEFDKQQKENHLLSPSKKELRDLKDCAEKVHEVAVYMDCMSKMAHQGVVDFEEAQEILKQQKEILNTYMGLVEKYAHIEEKERTS